jgi:hypothetical protein
MTRQSASVKNTAGEGFSFEDRVAASFLVDMLRRAFPLGAEAGYLTRLDWQAKDLGWHIDDLVLELENSRQEIAKAAITVKSNSHLNSNGFSAPFVEDAWAQWRGEPGKPFNSTRDFLVLAVGSLAQTVKEAWQAIENQAALTDPARLAARLAVASGQSDALQRKIFASVFDASANLVPPSTQDETAAIVARMRVIEWNASLEGEAVYRCVALTVEGSVEVGVKLWRRLQEIAKERRSGGTITLAQLLEKLRPDFNLKDYPDYQAAWETLDRISDGNRTAVRDVVGAGVQLELAADLEVLKEKLQQSGAVTVLGGSGAGKSALVAKLVSDPGAYDRVLWLRKAQLAQPSQFDIARVLEIRHELPVLIRQSTAERAAMVVDGFEQFEGDAFERALELIAVVGDAAKNGWHLILTCQTLPWREQRVHLFKVRNTPVTELPVQGPGYDQIFAKLKELPGMGAVLLRKDLRSTLLNLATLDQVVRTVQSRPFDINHPWIGETHVIDWIWDYWTGSGVRKYLRARFLEELGALDGEKASGALKVGDLRQDQLEPFGEAEQAARVHVSDSTIQFAHDIMGDWARYRMLRDMDDPSAADFIRSHSRVPRWGRAIRLYAQSLAEQGPGLDRWTEMLARFEGKDPDSLLAADLFTDSLTLATNSFVLLDQLWSSLIADKGKLLRRILQRLQATATSTHPAAERITDPELQQAARVYMRLPNPLYWFSMLATLREHAEDVARVSLNEAAACCLLYLRSLPEGFPAREDAAEVALTLAREVQGRLAEYGHYLRAAFQDVYEALLYAALEKPDEVGQIALELSHRRKQPRHALLREAEAAERRAEAREKAKAANPEEWEARNAPLPGTMIYFPPVPSAPWPDGPSERISESFIAAVMDTPAINALIEKRPAVAAEVIIAVCIEAPSDREDRPSILNMGGEGLTESKEGNPPMYFKGPFATFLQKEPDLALGTILRLVNFATERWFARCSGDPSSTEIPPALSWEFLVDGKNVRWMGNDQVFQWHRFIPAEGSAVGSALMALEKWFYDLLNEERDISPYARKLLAESRSLAFAGVLLSVGTYRPALFDGILQPMLTSIELFLAYREVFRCEVQEDWKLGLLSWARNGQFFVSMMAEWNQMPHRRLNLYETVQRLICSDSSTRALLALCSERWKIRRAAQLGNSARNTTRLETLFAILDPSNYTLREGPNGEPECEFKTPDSLQERFRRSLPRANAEQAVIDFPQIARQILKGAAILSGDEIDQWFLQFQRIALSDEESQVLRKYRNDAIAAGLAVLFVKHSDWMAQNAEREAWCLAVLRDLRVAADTYDPHPASVQSAALNAEAFRGEAALALLEHRSDPWILRAVIDGVTGFFYQSTSLCMYAAFARRSALGARFGELLSILHLWSAIRHGATILHGAHAWQKLNRYRDMLFERWFSGRLREHPVTFERAQLLGARLTVGALKRTGRYEWEKQRREHEKLVPRRDHKLELRDTNLDYMVLYYGYSFLGDIRTAEPSLASELLGYFRPLFSMQMATVPTLESGVEGLEIERGDGQYEIWIMELAALFMAGMEDRTIAQSIYPPILDLGAAAHYWVRDFLHAWFEQGLAISASPEEFGIRWGAMVDYALASPRWNRETSRIYFYLDALANDLLGITSDQLSHVSGDQQFLVAGTEFSVPIALIVPIIERWCDVWLKAPRALAHFAYFLSTPSGSALIGWGMVRVADALAKYSESDWEERNLIEGLTAAVQSCAKQINQQQFRDNLAFKAAFEAVLAHLTSRMVPTALQLRSELGG